MPATDDPRVAEALRDLATDPEFAPIKTNLALAFIAHKADVGDVGSDQEIVDHVDDITAILFGLTLRAMRDSDYEWMARFAWFGEIVDELTDDEPGKALDGYSSGS